MSNLPDSGTEDDVAIKARAAQRAAGDAARA